MRVICIEHADMFIQFINCKQPVIGEIYTVINSETCDCGCNTTAYQFSEIEGYWDSTSFIPISDIDETEMERDYSFKELTVI